MLALSPFRSKAAGLPDLLQFAALIDEHILLLKNGALLRSYAYAGKDLESSTSYERNALSGAMNSVLARLGSGWCTYHDAIRQETTTYLPGQSQFPDAISRAIEAERRGYFQERGTAFESYYILTFVWMPPTQSTAKVAEMMYTVDGSETRRSIADRHLEYFRSQTMNIVGQLSSYMSLRPLGQYVHDFEDGSEVTVHELLQYLNFTISGNDHRIALPTRPMYLDAVIGAYDFYTGVVPKIDGKVMGIVGIEGFPVEAFPNILSDLDSLPQTFRWSNRFIYLDRSESVAQLTKYRAKWSQKIRGWKDQIFDEERGPVNLDALDMTNDADVAIAKVNSGQVANGFYNSTLIIFGASLDEIDEATRKVQRLINNRGFVARIETLNAVEAYLGSIPGHTDYNVRRPFISTENLADLIPLSSIWAGSPYAECPFYPPRSPALMQCAAAGSTPFRFNLHVNDVGHTAILGPTGGGKSTLLSFIQAQALRYRNATIFTFDKLYSAYAICRATGGTHFDIASDASHYSFCPLARIDKPSEFAWASEWIEALLGMQGVQINPSARETIRNAMLLLRESPTRSLTEFSANVQSLELRDALKPYTIDGALAELLDGEKDDLSLSRFNVFEINHLMELGDTLMIPVLTYLFHRIETSLLGQPAFLILDEAWIALSHPVFRGSMRKWLKELRKSNCAVVLATQSLSDLSNSGIADVIVESCPTKVLLPNPTAVDEVSRVLYQDLMGLNQAQIEMIATATPKKDYYYISPNGRRMFDLALQKTALAFCAVSGREAKNEIDALIQTRGEKWIDAWLAVRS